MNNLFKFLKKRKSSKIVRFRKSKNPQIQKVNFFFEKSMSPLKILRIFLRSFLVLNDQNRNGYVFFKFGRRRAKRVSERSEVRNIFAKAPFSKYFRQSPIFKIFSPKPHFQNIFAKAQFSKYFHLNVIFSLKRDIFT